MSLGIRLYFLTLVFSPQVPRVLQSPRSLRRNPQQEEVSREGMRRGSLDWGGPSTVYTPPNEWGSLGSRD